MVKVSIQWQKKINISAQTVKETEFISSQFSSSHHGLDDVHPQWEGLSVLLIP